MMNGEIKRKINTTRDILVGVVPTPNEQVQQITYALIYKFMDDMDQEAAEKYGSKPEFFSGEYEKYAWHNLMSPQLSGQEKVNRYTEGIEKMQYNDNLPKLFRDMFKNAFVPFRNANTLNMFLKEIDGFKYDHSEELGNAYEYLLSVMASQGDAGQFRTPRHIIDFIVEVVDPKRDETILDPACGTAGFLISAYKHIKRKEEEEKKEFKLKDQKHLAENLVGYDVSPQMAQLSRVNMYLHKFPDPKIYEYDTLSSEERWDEKFDVIMANPPFMSPKGGIQPHSRFSVIAKKSEVLFVDYIMSHLNPRGRAGVIVPEGIVFKSENAYKQLRKMLIDDNYLYAVVSLPAGVFQPYAGVKTSILLMDRELAKKTDDILFVKIENDGYELGATRKEIDKNDLPESGENIKKYQDYLRTGKKDNEFIKYINDRDKKKEKLKVYDKYAVVDKSKIAENEYNLSAERYREEADYSKVKWPMVELGEVCDIKRGELITKKQISENNQEGPIPVIAGGREPAYYCNTSNRDPDVITVSGSGAYAGFVNYFAMPIFASDCLTIKPNDENKLKPLFLYHLLKVKQDYIYSLQSGGGQPHVYPKDLKKIKIPLPPIEEQEKIVAELDRYQKIIDGAQQVVDNYQPTIKINPEWEIIQLRELCKFEYGKALKSSNRKRGEYPVYGSNGIIGYHNEYLVKAPFVVVGRKGTAGAVYYSELNGWPIDTTFYIREAHLKKMNILFLFFILRHLNLRSLNTQSGVPGLNRNDVYRINIPVPPINAQKKIVQQIIHEQKLVDQNKELINIFQQKIQDRINEVWGE